MIMLDEKLQGGDLGILLPGSSDGPNLPAPVRLLFPGARLPSRHITRLHPCFKIHICKTMQFAFAYNIYTRHQTLYQIEQAEACLLPSELKMTGETPEVRSDKKTMNALKTQRTSQNIIEHHITSQNFIQHHRTPQNIIHYCNIGRNAQNLKKWLLQGQYNSTLTL